LTILVINWYWLVSSRQHYAVFDMTEASAKYLVMSRWRYKESLKHCRCKLAILIIASTLTLNFTILFWLWVLSSFRRLFHSAFNFYFYWLDFLQFFFILSQTKDWKEGPRPILKMMRANKRWHTKSWCQALRSTFCFVYSYKIANNSMGNGLAKVCTKLCAEFC